MKKKDFASSLALFKEEKRLAVHSFHRYFGKLIPGIPAWAIETFTNVGDKVLDPFSGSGTTVVEAKQRGRYGFGYDINPLANFVAKIKTTYIPSEKLLLELERINVSIKMRNKSTINEPYVVNMDHWFRSEVKAELLILKEIISEIEDVDVRNFYTGVFSAFLRGVSNADPQHVFPGYSKRMRALDEAGRKIDVIASFNRASKKRIQQISELVAKSKPTNLITGSFTSDETYNSKLEGQIDLVVTNPPYISSIRYLETMKIEMGFLEFLDSQSSYLALDKKVIGTERFYKAELQQIPSTNYKNIDAQIESIKSVNLKMAKTVAEYFIEMDKVFFRLSKYIKNSGYLVIKISDSKVRNQVITTSDHFITICSKYGFKLVDNLIDEFDPNSRSLLTARNTYSGIMTFDHVIILQKK